DRIVLLLPADAWDKPCGRTHEGLGRALRDKQMKRIAGGTTVDDRAGGGCSAVVLHDLRGVCQSREINLAVERLLLDERQDDDGPTEMAPGTAGPLWIGPRRLKTVYRHVAAAGVSGRQRFEGAFIVQRCQAKLPQVIRAARPPR